MRVTKAYTSIKQVKIYNIHLSSPLAVSVRVVEEGNVAVDEAKAKSAEKT